MTEKNGNSIDNDKKSPSGEFITLLLPWLNILTQCSCKLSSAWFERQNEPLRVVITNVVHTVLCMTHIVYKMFVKLISFQSSSHNNVNEDNCSGSSWYK